MATNGSAPTQPPHSIEAEEAVLAALMVAPGAMADVRPLLSAGQFWSAPNGAVWAACEALWDRRTAINEITVAHELSRRGRLDEAGGLGFLSRIIGELPTPVGVEHHAGIVRDTARRREIITAAAAITRLAWSSDLSAGELADAALSMIAAVCEGAADGDVELYPALPAIADRVKANLALGGRGVPTGLAGLDAILTLAPGTLSIVAARTSIGKTALLLHIVRHLVSTGERRVFGASLEMSADQLWGDRLLTQREAGVRWRAGRSATESELAEIDSAVERISSWPGTWILADATRMTVDSLRARVERAASSAPLDLVVVDYLQLVDSGARADRRYEELGAVSRKLKALALALGVPVLAAAQLNREADKMQHPTLAHLRESGSIEQDADAVLALCECERAQTAPDRVVAHVLKNRNGRAGGIVALDYSRARGMWSDAGVRL